MAKAGPLDFGDGPEPDSSPQENPTQEQITSKKPTKKPPAAKTPAKPVVICQRCKVPCQPMPQSRGWVQCPKCRWKHKTFDALEAAKQALRGKQSRAAR